MINIVVNCPELLGRARTEIARVKAYLADNPFNALNGYGEVLHSMGYVRALYCEQLICRTTYQILKEEIRNLVLAKT